MVVSENFGYGIPLIYQYRQGKMGAGNCSNSPVFLTVMSGRLGRPWKIPVLGILPGALEARGEYLPGSSTWGKKPRESGLPTSFGFSPRRVNAGPDEHDPHFQGNRPLAMGREDEALGEYQFADRLEHGRDNGVGAYLKMASFFEERGDLRRAALSYEKALDRLGQKETGSSPDHQGKSSNLAGENGQQGSGGKPGNPN